MKFLMLSFFAFLQITAIASGVPRQAWTVDTEDLRMRNLSMIYGETLDLECTFRNYFSALDIEGASVTLHARTNGMDAAESYQVTGYSEAGGKAVVRVDVDAWLPQGLESVDYTLAVVRAGTTRILRAFGTVYLRGSSAANNHVPMPMSVYAVLQSELTNHIAWAEAEISALQSGLANALKPSDTNGYLRLPDLPDETDPRAMRAYHYGDPDIEITPAGDFGFNPLTGTITGYTGSNPNIVLPYEINGVPVVAIGANAFDSNEVIKKLIAPKTLTTIGNDAFMYSSLTSLDAPALTSIGESAFAGSPLTSLDAPALTSIGDNAFAGSFLTSLDAPVLTTIGNSAFAYSTLTSLSAPALTSIDHNAFENSPLTSLDAPALTSIGNDAFMYSSLTSLDAPALTSIGDNAFAGSFLTSIYYGGNQPTSGANIYDGTPTNLVSYVTDPTATGWGDTFGGRPVVRLPLYGSEVHGGEVYSGGEPVLTASTFLPPFTNMLLFADGGTNYYPRWDQSIGTFIVTGVPQ